MLLLIHFYDQMPTVNSVQGRLLRIIHQGRDERGEGMAGFHTFLHREGIGGGAS